MTTRGCTPWTRPAFSSCKALDRLPATMSAERVDNDRWHDKSSPAPCRFRLDELRALMRDLLRTATHSEHTGVEVDVAPHKSERLALAQAESRRD